MHEIAAGLIATLYMTIIIALSMILALAVWDGIKWAARRLIARWMINRLVRRLKNERAGINHQPRNT
jgi:hypothetical protein